MSGLPVTSHEPRFFTMLRHADESGVSGTGRVLDGVHFHTGQVVICWRTDIEAAKHGHSSLGIYPTWEAFEFIHLKSHPTNKTELVWLVAETADDACMRRATDEASDEARTDLRWCAETLIRQRDRAARERASLYSALVIAAEKFREYEQIHRKKLGTSDPCMEYTIDPCNEGLCKRCGHEPRAHRAADKAQANAKMAEFCENTLAGAR